jgi:pimeloyl-ACP methyl ester carboxylesterase
MLSLSPDPNFHFQLLRMLASVRSSAADVGELLNICEKIKPGDFESWYDEFDGMARWVKSTIEPEHGLDKVSLRDAYYRISRYAFASGFYLTGNEHDERLIKVWKDWTLYFQKAANLMDIPPEHSTLQADGFTVPVMLFRASLDDRPRPCVILGSGLDGSMEEIFHFYGPGALERGYHVVIYEGPGQTGFRRAQGLGFIHDWERVVSPVVDWLGPLPFIDSSRVSLLGLSLGGYLAARAAAFEHRLAAVILIDGIFDVFQSANALFGSEVMQYDQTDTDQFHRELELKGQSSTSIKWITGQFKWAFTTATAHEALQKIKRMTLAGGILDQVQCPVFVGDAEHDLYVASSQPPLVAAALGKKATYKQFTKAESADAHCHVGATAFQNQVIYKWLDEQIALPN